MLRALLWDVDGTLAETERDGHRVAFNMAFKEFGLPWRWSEAEYGALLRITGGRERLLADWAHGLRAGVPEAGPERERLAAALHRRKNAIYAQIVARGVSNAAGLAGERLRERLGVDAGDRDVATQPVDHHRPEGEPEALVELGRLAEGVEVQVCGELLGGPSHSVVP